MIENTLSHYRIQEKIGEGGMGVVYKAHDTQLGRLVAIKVLPADKVADAERKLRFAQEAKAASALNHPNIVTIYDIGSADGADFIVMEYVAGRTLDHLIPKGGMKTGELLKYAIQMADALGRAHAAGIVHRDLKPGNIMITEEGQVKLLDFGLAKLSDLHDASDAELTKRAGPETQEGSILGTVSYMSPEQAEARRVDARSDIFSFGAVLYEMATGKRAFLGRSKISTLAAILQSNPTPAGELHAGIPRDLQNIIQRCLRKEPGSRHQSAADLKVLLLDIQREAESSEPETAPIAATSRSSLRWIAALAVGLTLGVAGTWWFASRAEHRSVAFGPIKPLTTYSGLEYDPALSPDGNQVAFSWNGEKKDNFDIYVRLVEGGAALRLTADPAADHAPAWSPDGGRIAFLRDTAIYIIPALGGVERKLTQFPQGSLSTLSPISWSPDGKWLAVSASEDSSPRSIWIVSTESGEFRRASTVPKGYFQDASPAFSPDGHTLAFVRARDNYSRAVVFGNVNPDGTIQGPLREATGFDQTLESLAWQADGRSLVVSVRQSLGHCGLWRLTMAGLLQPLSIDSGDLRWPSLSRNGSRLAYEKRHTDFNIYRMDGPGPDGGPRSYDQCHTRAVVDSTAHDREAMLSPDDRRFVFNSDRSGFNEIYVARADGSNQAALTALGPTSMGSPRWSPDGQTVAFDRYEDGHSVIYAVRADGGKPRRLTKDPASDIRPSFSRDGKWIYFSSNRRGREEIWKMPSAGGASQQVTHDSGNEPFESPDGKVLYYATGHGLWSLPAGGGEPRLVLPEASFPLYAVAGRSIYYGIRNPASIWVLRTDTGRKFEYVRFPKDVVVFNGGGTAFTVSADERTIMYSQTDSQESDLMLVENFK